MQKGVICSDPIDMRTKRSNTTDSETEIHAASEVHEGGSEVTLTPNRTEA